MTSPNVDSADVGKKTSPLVIAAIVSTILGAFMCVAVIGGIVAWRWTASPAGPSPAPQPKAPSIGDLVPAEVRPQVAQFYRDLAAAAELGYVGTKDQFLTAHNIGTRILDKTIGDPVLAPASEAIQKYLLENLGDTPGAVPANLPAILQALAEEID